MNNKFCNVCGNLLKIQFNTKNNLEFTCNSGCYVEQNIDSECSIYSNKSSDKNIVRQELFLNKYTIHDPTLPTINKKCKKCDKTAKHKFIEIDSENLIYIYICTECGQKIK